MEKDLADDDCWFSKTRRPPEATAAAPIEDLINSYRLDTALVSLVLWDAFEGDASDDMRLDVLIDPFLGWLLKALGLIPTKRKLAH